MRVLFAILILAFAGLLWASLSAAQHIRRARRRRRQGMQPPSARQRSIHAVPAPPPIASYEPLRTGEEQRHTQQVTAVQGIAARRAPLDEAGKLTPHAGNELNLISRKALPEHPGRANVNGNPGDLSDPKAPQPRTMSHPRSAHA